MIVDRLLFRRSAPRVGALAPRDAGVLADIHAEGFARSWDAHDIERMLADSAVVGDGVYAGAASKPAGFVLSRVVLDEAEILTIAVSRAVQGRGFGRALLAAHLARLASRGARTVFLEVEEGNLPALKLYRAFGFVETGRRDGYYRKPDGRRVAALTMSRALA